MLVSAFVCAPERGKLPGTDSLDYVKAVETWFLPYQTPSYQMAYCSTDKKAFSHGQARKFMAAKFIASLLAVIISVPYWTWKGLIEP